MLGILDFPVGSPANTAYSIARSLRFNSPDSAYLTRTPGAAGNRRTFTLSMWVKKIGQATRMTLIDGYASSAGHVWEFQTDDTLLLYQWGTGPVTVSVQTNRVSRDPSGWMHWMLVIDTTQATAANRVAMYMNGQAVSFSGSPTYPALNDQLYIGNNIAHNVGRRGDGSFYFSGYIAEIHYVDGSALSPSSFGETDATTGEWKPKRYTGSYGTQGFYLPFSDNSGTTSTTLGKDTSGNSNNWTPTNFSVTAGSGNDSLTDTPTSNYCTLSTLPVVGSLGTVTQSGLSFQSTVSGYRYAYGTFGFTSGKWYFEVTIDSSNGSGNNQGAGIASLTDTAKNFILDCFATSTTSSRKLVDDSPSGSYGSVSAGTVLGVAIDADNGKAYLAVANTWIDSSSPTGGTGGYSLVSGHTYAPVARAYNSGISSFNFGQRAFTYTPPTGFVAVCAENLPTPAIAKPASYFDGKLYTGSGAAQSVTGVGFQPDLVWLKNYSGSTRNHVLADSTRGTGIYSSSSATSAETSDAQSVAAFNSDGFSVGTFALANTNTESEIAWLWKEGATPGLDIVSYSGDNTSNRAISHSLGVAPHFAIVKRRDSTSKWWAWHRSLAGATSFLDLSATSGPSTTNTPWGTGSWGASSFMVTNNGTENANGTGATYIAYLWAGIAGFSRFDTYKGNASSDGPFVFCGFRPRFVLVKRADATAADWVLLDSARNGRNPIDSQLFPNTTAIASTSTTVDFCANGFKIRNTGSAYNASGVSYIFAAFAEMPLKYALAR